MLIKIKQDDGLLHFESDGNTLSALIENFDELFISNNSMTFNCEDVDGSIQVIPNGLSCIFTRNEFSPWFACDEVHIKIEPERIVVFGQRDGNCIVQVRLV